MVLYPYSSNHQSQKFYLLYICHLNLCLSFNLLWLVYWYFISHCWVNHRSFLCHQFIVCKVYNRRVEPSLAIHESPPGPCGPFNLRVHIRVRYINDFIWLYIHNRQIIRDRYKINDDLLSIALLHSLRNTFKNLRISIDSSNNMHHPGDLRVTIIEESQVRYEVVNFTVLVKLKNVRNKVYQSPSKNIKQNIP